MFPNEESAAAAAAKTFAPEEDFAEIEKKQQVRPG